MPNKIISARKSVMPRDVYNTGSNSEHGKWLNKCVANFNWPIINIFVFQNSTVEILDKNQKIAGEFFYWYLKKAVKVEYYIYLSPIIISHIFSFLLWYNFHTGKFTIFSTGFEKYI